MSNAIKEVLNAEHDADLILETAHKKQVQELAEAKQKTLQLFEQGKRTVDEKLDASLQKQRASLDTVRANILKQAEADAAALGKKARAKLDKAVDLLMNKFEDCLR